MAVSGTVYVLLLTFFLHGGMVETKTITAESMEMCESSKPWIVKDYMKHPISMGKFSRPIDALVGECIKVSIK